MLSQAKPSQAVATLALLKLKKSTCRRVAIPATETREFRLFRGHGVEDIMVLNYAGNREEIEKRREQMCDYVISPKSQPCLLHIFNIDTQYGLRGSKFLISISIAFSP